MRDFRLEGGGRVLDWDYLWEHSGAARSRLELPNGLIVLQFAIYEERFIQDGDGYGPVLRHLLADEPERNIFCCRATGELVWRVGQRPAPPKGWRNSFVDAMRLDADGWIDAGAWMGDLYKIDPSNGEVRRVGWTK